MPKPDLTEEEQAAVAAALRKLIAEDKFPFSPRLRPLKSGLAEAEPEAGKATHSNYRRNRHRPDGGEPQEVETVDYGLDGDDFSPNHACMTTEIIPIHSSSDSLDAR
jgi:hypothetical protein